LEKKIDEEEFLQAYLSELDYFAARVKKRQVKTVFFGGGTPSLMPTYFVERILDKISKIWHLEKNAEITLEANPTSFEALKFKDFKKAGINRLSIGIQSLNDADLKFLGRQHSASEAISTIKQAGEIFENYSFDLIYGRPNQTLNSWKEELNQALSLGTKHLSLYQLTIEKGTPFYRQYLDGKFKLPDDDLAADLYEATDEICGENGLELYEISNYAKKGWQSRHNLVYWQGGDYLGIGAGAHSRIYFDGDELRSALNMFCEPKFWMKSALGQKTAIQKLEKISKEELLEEIILMGLRLKDGIVNEVFVKHFGKNIDQIFDSKKLQDLIKNNLLEVTKDFIRIPKNSLILTNSIINKTLQVTRSF
jgi:oxygen-independent coproporphyrinogen-3 oxidase